MRALPALSRTLPPTARRSVNNGFDQAAAAAVTEFCFQRGVPLTVVSRMAVPMLPMQLAKSYGARPPMQLPLHAAAHL